MVSGIESANLKLVRASEHLSAINGVIRKAAAVPNSYEIIKDANGKEVVNFLIPPDPQIAILAGEIIYQLRSALDHLAFDLVQRNSPKFERSSFPLWAEIPKELLRIGHTKPPLPYNCFHKTLPGIPIDAFAFIESIQPYRGGVGAGIPNIVDIIAKLTNIDKHRHLYPILPKIAVHQEIAYTKGQYKGFTGTSTMGGLGHGAEIKLPDAPTEDGAMYVKRSFTPYVTFNEIVGSGTDTLESQNVLELCLKLLQGTIIPTFTNLLKNP